MRWPKTTILDALTLAACLLCVSCAMRHVQIATVPGCPTARVTIPKTCGADSYVRELQDHTEVVCTSTVIVGGKVRKAEQVLRYTCITNPTQETK